MYEEIIKAKKPPEVTTRSWQKTPEKLSNLIKKARNGSVWAQNVLNKHYKCKVYTKQELREKEKKYGK